MLLHPYIIDQWLRSQNRVADEARSELQLDLPASPPAREHEVAAKRDAVVIDLLGDD